MKYHLVISTYKRQQMIPQGKEKLLYRYINNFCKERNVGVIALNGMPEHVHMLCEIPATIALSEFMKVLKSESSKFLRQCGHFPKWNRWAKGYGGFTVDPRSVDVIKAYIDNQKKHHQRGTFYEEYLAILKRYGLTTDEVLGDEDEA